jgi:hypothetical protein
MKNTFILDLSGIESKIDKLSKEVAELKEIIISKPQPIPPQTGDEIVLTEKEWKEKIETGLIELQDGITYKIPNYTRANITKDLTITCKGKSKIIFGRDFYNQWSQNSEDKVIFSLGRWNNKIRIENVDLDTGKLVNEVQPFYRTLFQNTHEKNQTGTIELINSNTTLQLGLLYSGSQNEFLTVITENVNFEGIIWQELKANNGGGLLSIMTDCNLTQVEPPTYFKSKIKLLDSNTLESYIAFRSIENQFIEFGNSCNIVFLDGKTFYLPKSNELGNTKTIRTIPKTDDVIQVEWTQPIRGTRYLSSNKFELQAGDEFQFNGEKYRILVKDRTVHPRFVNEGYPIDYALDKPLPTDSGMINIKITKSTGNQIIGKEFDGYLIFKYNRNFQTNVNVDHGLNYMLASNPFGVLSYNHKEITAKWTRVNHKGYYRQSSSAVGHSHGYTLIDCTDFGDEFKPD